jgi:beta-phosphoglucomutase
LSAALLFDLDGVIVDSMPLHTAVWREYLERHQIDATHLLSHMHGARNDALVRTLFGEHLSEAEVDAHGAAKEALFRERLDVAKHLVPGIASFLDRHAAAPKAVGSNAEPANIAHVLEGAGLTRHFPVIVDGSQVTHGKPAPDIYLRAAEQLGTLPAHCIVFEDSPTGVAAARAAGMRVVGVNTARLADFPAVDLLIDDFHSPELALWLQTQPPGTR